MRSFVRPAAAIVAFAAILGILSPMRLALAQSVHATLYIVAGDLPRTLGSSDQVLRYARSHRARQLNESDDAERDRRHWNATVVTQFARPFTDRNFTLLFYDVTDSPRSMVGSPMDIFVRGNESIVASDVRMERPRFRPARDIEVVLTVRHVEAGRARVRLNGEVPRGNGSLDFTSGDPEARSR